MRVGVAAAKSRFSELLRLASQGRRVVITKYGKPIVRLRGFPNQRSHEGDDPIARLLAKIARDN
ncbi:type II toxin-antitoxin system prevent-host-death family antitoxin [Acidobacterium sp. S8]|uniref:type II toxin-antitoxin system Phd/YefM family antitoxin n=1 Tax=Acidobacterium sp. S8 TaxID=1641854 RepID=UPI00131E033C